jgi:hypothetical protein
MRGLDEFTLAYIEAALWSSTDDDDVPLDKNNDIGDIAPQTLRRMVADALKFQSDNWDDISADLEGAGCDFWLTRNGHGAGFWDGGWEEEAGKRLTAASEEFGEFNLYAGDDGRIHGQ